MATIKPDKLPEELDALLKDFLHTSFKKRQEAVQAGAEVFRDAISAATPRDTGEMAKSWKIKTKYKNKRYVGNTRVAKTPVHRKTKSGEKEETREGVPLSNLLEHSDNSPHKGFIRQCFNSNQSRIYAAIKSKLGGN